ADAEEIEHILTPELERELDALLGTPTRDPEGHVIPREA
ncbi:MAG: metal-dependent transcriptional regulator, partial [Deltaproteobacteria bacterium]|nr:metal-dependent transcriptional regulator [Deltaproteobacteria bacterium]